MNPADVRYRDHTEAAVELLARAADIEKGPRCHLAKTYASMASVHAALAANALVELTHTPPLLVMPGLSTESDTPLDLGHDRMWVIPNNEEPPYQQAWPDNVLMGTEAHHSVGDISRDEPDYFVVVGETADDWIGNWLEGLGFVGVRFPKSTSRPLTAGERERLANSQVVIE